MVYKGVEYEFALIEPGIWKWQLRIGGQIKAGKTKTNLEPLADRRARMVIDRELKAKSTIFRAPQNRTASLCGTVPLLLRMHPLIRRDLARRGVPQLARP